LAEKQKRFNVEQIVAVLKQAEARVPLAERLHAVRLLLRSLKGVADFGQFDGDGLATA
jgi:hypothetical protein